MQANDAPVNVCWTNLRVIACHIERSLTWVVPKDFSLIFLIPMEDQLVRAKLMDSRARRIRSDSDHDVDSSDWNQSTQGHESLQSFGSQTGATWLLAVSVSSLERLLSQVNCMV